MKRIYKYIVIIFLLVLLVGCKSEEIVEYTIIFDGNGGVLVSGTEIQKITDSVSIIPPTYERDGFTFKGWNSDLEVITSDKIIKAEWEEIIQYREVIFDPNGGKLNSDEKITIKLGDKLTSPNDPIREGYTFDGWYLGEEKWSFIGFNVNEDITLVAKWTINQYSITLKFNDGVTEDQVITQDYNSSVTVTDPTRVGYTFDKWSEDIPTNMPAENKTIEANWIINQYSITLKFNDGVTEDQVIIQDYNSSVSIDNPTRIGYTFDKWSENIILMPSENKIIEASWKINQYSIILKNYYGISDKVITQDYNSNIAVENPIRIGYTFDKWSETIPTKMPAENKTIEASWTINQYSITFKFNDGVTEDKVITQDYNTNIVVTINNPIRTGYTFDKWSEDIPTNMPAANKTIEASWIINQYSITLKFNDGVTQDKVIIQDYNSSVIVNDPTREGYTFDKWSETIPTNMPAENKTIEASWIINQYSITLKNYYGTTDKVITQDYNSSITVVDPTRDGYKFDYWSETIPTNMPAENKTITAEWKCHVRYKIENNQVVITSFRVLNENIVILPSYEGYPVTSIGEKAFKGYTSLTSIEIPNSVTSIGNQAFYNCRNLTSVVLSNSLISIGDYAFSFCIALSTVELPNSLKNIGEESFSYCSSITNLEIPNSVTSIGSSAFSNCTGITSIEIPNSVTSIGSSVFSNCTSLTSIEIPNSVTSIGSSAFSNCTSLTNIEIPNSVTSIGLFAFYGCTSLTSLTIPFVGNTLNGTFNTNFAYIFGDDVNLSNFIPTSLKTIIITGGTIIEENAFRDCTSITNIEISNGVTSIGSYAFSNCTSLTNIEISNSVTSIGSLAFYNCTSLTSIEIPNSVTSIGSSVFSNCTSLTNIEIPNSITSIGDYGFSYCTSLINIVLPTSLTSIGSYSFINCTSLESIIISNNVTSIGDQAFSNCTNLSSIDISASYVGTNMFSYCSNLITLTISTNVTYLSSNAFYDCTNLTTINYDGTIEQWNSLSKSENWDSSTGAYIVHCSDGDVNKA